jgi:CBS domain containing-hemolysin-like protein
MNLQIIYTIVLLPCLGLSFLLSGMEAGVFALNRLRLRQLARSGKRSAQLLNGFLEKPERFLWTILVGNTLANFLILGWILAELHTFFMGETITIVILFAAIVFGFYVVCDLLPKMLFRAHPNSLCLSAARVFRLIHFLLSPLVRIVEDVSRALLRLTGGQTFTGRLFGNREELRAIMQESSQALTNEEHSMVNRILDLQNFTVGEVAIPLAQVVMVGTNTPLRAALELVRHRMQLSRLPVWELRDGQQRIAGLLDVGALLFRTQLELDKPVATQMSPAVFVNESMRLEVALRLMQRAGQRMAIVLSPDQKEVGIIALKDIFKVMFGEMKL